MEGQYPPNLTGQLSLNLTIEINVGGSKYLN